MFNIHRSRNFFGIFFLVVGLISLVNVAFTGGPSVDPGDMEILEINWCSEGYQVLYGFEKMPPGFGMGAWLLFEMDDGQVCLYGLGQLDGDDQLGTIADVFYPVQEQDLSDNYFENPDNYLIIGARFIEEEFDQVSCGALPGGPLTVEYHWLDETPDEAGVWEGLPLLFEFQAGGLWRNSTGNVELTPSTGGFHVRCEWPYGLPMAELDNSANYRIIALPNTGLPEIGSLEVMAETTPIPGPSYTPGTDDAAFPDYLFEADEIEDLRVEEVHVLVHGGDLKWIDDLKFRAGDAIILGPKDVDPEGSNFFVFNDSFEIKKSCGIELEPSVDIYEKAPGGGYSLEIVYVKAIGLTSGVQVPVYNLPCQGGWINIIIQLETTQPYIGSDVVSKGQIATVEFGLKGDSVLIGVVVIAVEISYDERYLEFRGLRCLQGDWKIVGKKRKGLFQAVLILPTPQDVGAMPIAELYFKGIRRGQAPLVIQRSGWLTTVDNKWHKFSSAENGEVVVE